MKKLNIKSHNLSDRMKSRIKFYASSFSIKSIRDVAVQDILDAIHTLIFSEKLITEIQAPGEGPEFFLAWAQAELKEAEGYDDESSKVRKYYNSSVLSKVAIECLIDWYLSKYLLHLTMPPWPGVAQKLMTLNAEEMLGISFSLFNDIVFEPRNKGIHRFELVEKKEAQNSLELAALTIKNCVNTVSPNEAPVYYGNLQISRGSDALEKMERKIDLKPNMAAFSFSGIGPKGEHGVFIDRDEPDGRICLLESIDEGVVEVLQCKIKDQFSSVQLRDMFSILEGSNPKTVFLEDHEQGFILESLTEHRKKRKG